MKSLVLAVVIAPMLSACATTHMDASTYPYTGYWYGEIQLSESGAFKRVVARHTDGTYWASYECIESIGCQSYKEHGVWGVDGNVYWVKTMLLINDSGPFYPENHDKIYLERYQITDFSDDEFEYQHIDSQQIYRSHRVSKEFASEFNEA